MQVCTEAAAAVKERRKKGNNKTEITPTALRHALPPSELRFGTDVQDPALPLRLAPIGHRLGRSLQAHPSEDGMKSKRTAKLEKDEDVHPQVLFCRKDPHPTRPEMLKEGPHLWNSLHPKTNIDKKIHCNL